MAYDEDDDDLFGEEFDFVDEDDEGAAGAADVESEKPAPAKPKKRPAPREKPPARAAKRPKAPPPGDKPAPRREPAAEGAPPAAEFAADEPLADEPPDDQAPPAPAGPPADHVVHVYEHGKFKRTIDRKFTDEEAVGFAEQYTRTGKFYGRYAIATPDDEEPAATFAGAAKG